MSEVDKARIREAMRQQRRAYNPAAAARDALIIRDRVLEIVAGAPGVMLYLTGKDNEVDTWPLIEQLGARGVAVFAPRVAGPGRLEWAPVRSRADTVAGAFGIPEPVRKFEAVVPPADALVVTPGLAFSPDGYRVGYGGGFYDRFLANHDGAAIGLAYDFQVLSHMPRAPYDMPVAQIVTPTRVIVCNSR
jgi:5-formyltetrahydrofolate cyclo-ligase